LYSYNWSALTFFSLPLIFIEKYVSQFFVLDKLFLVVIKELNKNPVCLKQGECPS
jgi:hypothetical protein